MNLVRITIQYTPLAGGNRRSMNVLTEADTTLDPSRIGDVLALNIHEALTRAFGFTSIGGRYRVKLANGETIDRCLFRGFYTTWEGSPLGKGRQAATYVKLAYENPKGGGIEQSVRIGNILSVEDLSR